MHRGNKDEEQSGNKETERFYAIHFFFVNILFLGKLVGNVLILFQCQKSVGEKEEADLGDGDVGLRAYSRCSMPYFLEVIKSVRKCPHKIKLVTEMGL